MEKYIIESLAAGIVFPYSSLLGARFCFVVKKDKILRLFIDFQGLNDIMVKNKYPLSLINTAFESVEGAEYLPYNADMRRC